MALLASWCVCKKTEWDFKRRLFEDGNGWKRSSTAATTSAASPPISPPINRRKEGQSWKKATKKYQKKTHKKYQQHTHTNKAPVRPRRQLAGQLIGGSNRAGKKHSKSTKKHTQIKYHTHPQKETKNHRQSIGGRSDRAGKAPTWAGRAEKRCKNSVLAVIFYQIKAQKKEYAKFNLG